MHSAAKARSCRLRTVMPRTLISRFANFAPPASPRMHRLWKSGGAPLTKTVVAAAARIGESTGRRRSRSAGEQFLRGLADQLTLMTRAREIQSTRVALSRTACDRGCAVRAAADDFVESHLPLVTVGQADDGHAEVQ